MNEVETEFETAVAMARYALEQFRREPIVQSQRGAARLNAWWRAWRQASEVARRWYQELDRPKAESFGFEHELDRLLAEEQRHRRES